MLLSCAAFPTFPGSGRAFLVGRSFSRVAARDALYDMFGLGRRQSQSAWSDSWSQTRDYWDDEHLCDQVTV